ncbi:MAG: hypothetical protein JWM81_5 [Candidatus Saccharibacteria bacterium]|nr:hypothetical protein [Candidatus Saccharibacteria bacterium]
MKSKYDVYQPSKLIQDFHAAPDSYYESDDITISPFTKVGALSDKAETNVTSGPTFQSYVQPPRQPVFAPGFSFADFLNRRNKPQSRKITVKTDEDDNLATHNELAKVFSGMIAQTYRSIIKFVKKYYFLTLASCKRALYTGTSRGPRAIVAASALFLLVLLGLYSTAIAPKINRKPTPANLMTTNSSSTAGSGQPKNSSAGNTSTHGTNGGTTSSNSSSAQAATHQPTTTTTLPSTQTPAVGGYGGGAPVSSDVPAGIPGVTTPVPATIPGQSVDSDGKPVVVTSPITITLN